MIFLIIANPALSQNQTAQTLEAWKSTASEAENLLLREMPNLAQLEALRSQLAEQRTQALERQDGLKTRIDRLTDQIAALGPAPEEGVSESEDVAVRRGALEAEISEARAPFLATEEAYRRADGLISEIDTILRRDFAKRLVHREASPLLPESWQKAASTNRKLIDKAMAEAGRRWTIQSTQSAMLPAAVVALLGLFVLFYIRPKVLRNVEALASAQTVPHVQIWYVAGLNFLRLTIPLAAAYFLIRAFDLINLFPLSLPGMDQVLLYGAAVLSAAYWLASSLFSPRAPSLGIVGLSSPRAWKLWRLVLALGVIPGLTALEGFFNSVAGQDIATQAVYQFPVTLVGAFLLYRLSSALNPAKIDRQKAEDVESVSEPVWNILLRMTSRVGRLAAVLAPITAALGYFNASIFLLIPPILSLGVFAIGYVIFDLFQRGIDSWVARGTPTDGQPGARLGLMPVLAAFGIICAALPVLALIWGMRVSDLTELWVYLRDGVQFGNSRISVTDFLRFVLVFGIGYTITRFLQTIMRRSVLPRTRLDSGGQNAVASGIGYVGYFLAAVLAISATGLDLSNLAIVAGALSVGVGFGLQTIVSNFVSGIILLIERPIKIGDWIEVGGHAGYVKSINVRSTEIQTFDRATVVVPNADLIAGTVLNWTHSSMTGRVIAPVGVAYGTDVRRVETILSEIAQAHPLVLRNPPPSVVFMGFGADSLDFEIRAILRDVNFMLSARSDMNFEILRRFEEEGIEIPFAQRDITIKNPEALRGS